MTGAEFKAIRKKLGWSIYQTGMSLGWVGSKRSISAGIRRIEADQREVSDQAAAKMIEFLRKMEEGR